MSRDTLGTVVPFALERLGVIMSPEPGNPLEVEGVLNPATSRSRDGRLLLYPRLVAAGNVSRVGLGEVELTDGIPTGVRREGIVLAPERAWERGNGHGGVEDPRVTTIPTLDTHVMTYVAFGPLGPKPALALSSDGETWKRVGPIQFGYQDELNTDLNLYPNKDVVYFPEPVPDPNGVESIALLHRPMWDFSFFGMTGTVPLPRGVDDGRASMWISYVPLEDVRRDITALTRPRVHRELANPLYEWEAERIGAGPAPIRVEEGWLVIHHGVAGTVEGSAFEVQKNVRYCAGAMILSAEDPSRVIARTVTPLLEPNEEQERDGTVPNVVFPTAVETIGARTFVFYGMADSRIGVAELTRTSAK